MKPMRNASVEQPLARVETFLEGPAELLPGDVRLVARASRLDTDDAHVRPTLPVAACVRFCLVKRPEPDLQAERSHVEQS
jgi:hypothetical protein